MMARQADKAFTLIELLTVVAIISLLISILTPSLSRARAQAKATACGARMHDMGAGLHVYANDFGGFLPVAEFDPEGECDKFGWAELMAEQLYRRRPPCEPNKPFPAQYNTDNIGRYYFYYFNCPALGKEADHAGHYRVYLPAWAYTSLQFRADGTIKEDADPLKGTALDSVPPQLPLLADARADATAYPSSYIGGGEGAEGTATFDDRHYGRVNLLYPDGHNELAIYDPDPNNPGNLFSKLHDDWDLNGKYPDGPNEL